MAGKFFCFEVKERQVKKGSKWVTTDRIVKHLDVNQYRLSCGKETQDWFNNMFGEGTFKTYGEQTSEGYRIVKAVSTSPNKVERSVSNYYHGKKWQYHDFEGGI